MRVESPSSDANSASLVSNSAQDDEIDLIALLRTLWRGKWVIFLVAVAAIFVGAYYAYRVAVPVYSARAVVVLESRQDQVVDIASVMTGLSGDQATINTEVEVLRSRGLVEKLVKRMDLTNDPEFNPLLREVPLLSTAGLKALIFGTPTRSAPDPQAELDATVDAVRRAVSVSNVRQSYVFLVSAESTSPAKAAEMANTLAELYILDQLEVKFQATEQATTWLSDRVTVLQAELETAAEAVKEFSANTDLVSVEELEMLNRRVKESRDRLSALRTSLEGFAGRLAELQAAKASGNREDMAAIAQDATLSRILRDGGDDATFDARFDLVLQRAQLDVDRATEQASALESSIAEQETQYTRQSADLVELQQLQREAEASRLIYEFFLSRLKETSVQQGIQQADSRLLSKAAVPRRPTAPRKSVILVLSAILGLLLGAAIILVREFVHKGFRTADELARATGYTVMGQIPRIPARKRLSVMQYLVDKPTSAAAEAVRNLRTSALLSNVDEPPKVFMVTSSIPGEGKTTTSIALAHNLAGLDKKVLLVEGDIRRRVMSNYFDLKGKHGLLSVVTGETPLSEAAQRSDLLGIDILIGEKTSTNAADIFSSRRFHDFVAEAREAYDYVVIDTAPVLVVPDARIIAQAADAVLYGVKWDKTSRIQVLEGLKQFQVVNIHVTGLVLEQIDPKGMKRYGYGGNYGAYSAYGKGYYDT
ncbi:MAG TPA: polysaccharide biosynthesis tyrosine autokinase [Aliiroseovarius sp.]|nr:polysaccharide biosynthesis tyrosine autokinase [Aliiroseovarius sp.]